jgi:hypothetical protein
MPYAAKNIVQLGNILESSIGAGLIRRFAITSRILNLWPAILPRHLAENCIPTQLVNGVLTVETPSSSYSFDLRCESSNIIARLHQEFGNKVRKLSIISTGLKKVSASH